MEEKTERGMKRALIVTGGYADTGRLRTILAPFSRGEVFVVAADSGLRTATELGIMPDLIVGDFDSYTGTLPDGPEILRVPAEKDVTDTVLACEKALEHGCASLCIVGGTGGRADHSLANILWICSLKKRGVEAVLTDGNNEFRMLSDESAEIPFEEGRYFSLFPAGPCAVTAVGCRYPLPEFTELTLDNPSFAVSNEVTAQKAVVTVRGSVLLVRSRKEHLPSRRFTIQPPSAYPLLTVQRG